MAQYAKEFDFYDQVARLAARKIEAELRAEGVRAMVTSRAKSVDRLKDKLHKRNSVDQYASVEAVYEDIVDLAGVRIALYFPGEREKVGKLIDRLFDCHLRKDFPSAEKGSTGRRFSGYSATHYRVRLRVSELDEPDRRYAVANIEFQVASVLMHAWSEVEHDLVYKPFEGKLSPEEYSFLDQLNGLVLAGEIGLEQLQRAGEARVAEADRRFSNHYELAAHLLSAASEIRSDEVTEQGVGRVDLLFALVSRLQLDTPRLLRPYLHELHGDLERRPLADQIIDAILTEDTSRYETFREIRDSIEVPAGRHGREHESYIQTGILLESWVKLERLMRELFPSDPGPRPPLRLARQLEEAGVIDAETLHEIVQLSRTRNAVVHGVGKIPVGHLRESARRVDSIIEELRKKLP